MTKFEQLRRELAALGDRLNQAKEDLRVVRGKIADLETAINAKIHEIELYKDERSKPL